MVDIEAFGLYIPSECTGLFNTAVLALVTCLELDESEAAREMVPRLCELRRRAGTSDRVVLVTDEGSCFTRLTQVHGTPLVLQ